MAVPTSNDLTQIPSDLVRAFCRHALEDANMVAWFLEGLFRGPASQQLVDNPQWLTREFLLALSAAMRLKRWERNGVTAHLKGRLPSAQEVLVNACKSHSDPVLAARIAGLPRQLIALFENHFAWAARDELQADIVLDEVEDVKLLDAIADFLWENRRGM